MAQFCSCGSLIIDGKCTNKSCNFRVEQPEKEAKTSTRKTAGASRSTKKNDSSSKSSSNSKTRKASKCVTYKIEDLGKLESKSDEFEPI